MLWKQMACRVVLLWSEVRSDGNKHDLLTSEIPELDAENPRRHPSIRFPAEVPML